MLIQRHEPDYHFIGRTEDGVTFRWGPSLDADPASAPWPELADISISNHCSFNCSFCYRNSKPDNSFMSVEKYALVLDQLTHPQWGSVFQVALGGGEPLEHPQFFEIINETNARNIIANFTTNGQFLTPKVAEKLQGKIGAAALSLQKFDNSNLYKTQCFTDQGIKTNLHFILDAYSIHEAIRFLKGEYDERLSNINAVVFLTYKNAGRASASKCLKKGNDLDRFLSLVSFPYTKVRYGFDACFVPLILKQTNIDSRWVDSCECAFFSVYVDEKMNVKPCSFTNTDTFTFSLNDYSFQTIWDEKFIPYRKQMKHNKCRDQCDKRSLCRGNCLFYPELALCG